MQKPEYYKQEHEYTIVRPCPETGNQWILFVDDKEVGRNDSLQDTVLAQAKMRQNTVD